MNSIRMSRFSAGVNWSSFTKVEKSMSLKLFSNTLMKKLSLLSLAGETKNYWKEEGGLPCKLLHFEQAVREF